MRRVCNGAGSGPTTAAMLLDALLPPCCLACGVLLRRPVLPELCTRCLVAVAPLPEPLRRQGDASARFAYDGPLAEAMTRCKYGADAALAGALGRALTPDPLWSCAPDGAPWDVVTCIPMHPWRRMRRGFDHAALMLRHAHRARPTARRLPRLLTRLRNDPPQATLPAATRLTNLVGAFAVARGAPALVGARVLVIDDVTTTGATLGEAIAALRRAGAICVGGLALLRTLTD